MNGIGGMRLRSKENASGIEWRSSAHSLPPVPRPLSSVPSALPPVYARWLAKLVSGYEFRVTSKKSLLAPCASRLATSSGVTLIELLIAIAIIATLSAVFLGASRAAMESARAARTKTTISKLHTLLMEQYASYETRRVDPGKKVLAELGPNPTQESIADLRLLALRETMKFEMPDRWSDIDMTVSPVFSGYPAAFLDRPPAVAQIYYRRFQKALNVTNNDIAKVEVNGSAECLYLTIMLLTGDGEARTLFSSQDIGDTDEDGAPEFLDGWGNPIRWVRWPAGFVPKSSLMSGDPSSDHDPFDPFRRNSPTASPAYTLYPSSIQNYIRHLRGQASSLPASYTLGYRTVPLIFSMGPDGIGDVSTRTTIVADSATIALDPYAWDSTYLAYEFGSAGDNPVDPDGDDNSIDNITNHVLDNR